MSQWDNDGIAALLTTNTALSSRQLAQVRSQLEQIDNTISELQAEYLPRLSQQMAVKQRYLLLLSPLRRVPDEVLMAIFLRCVPEDLNACSMSPLDAPLVLTHVCSRWRTIALQTSRLWSKIVIRPPKLFRTSFQRDTWLESVHLRQGAVRRAQEWASRCPRGAVQVYIDVGCPTAIRSEDLSEWLESIIRPVAPRVQHLTLLGGCLDMHMPLLSICDQPPMLPDLRSVIIGNNLPAVEMGYYLNYAPIQLFCGSDKLEIADIAGIQPFHLPGVHLTKLHIDCWATDTVEETLRAYPKLRDVCFRKVKMDSIPRRLGFGPTFPRIESLSLDYTTEIEDEDQDDQDGDDAFRSRPIARLDALESFGFPSLTRLHIKATFDKRMDVLAPVHWYTLRHTASVLANLTSLDLDGPIDVTQAIMVLKSATELRYLHVVLYQDDDPPGPGFMPQVPAYMTAVTFLGDLVSTRRHPDTCPFLEELELETECVPVQVIRRMVWSRQGARRVAKFRRLTVYGDVLMDLALDIDGEDLEDPPDSEVLPGDELDISDSEDEDAFEVEDVSEVEDAPALDVQDTPEDNTSSVGGAPSSEDANIAENRVSLSHVEIRCRPKPVGNKPVPWRRTFWNEWRHGLGPRPQGMDDDGYEVIQL